MMRVFPEGGREPSSAAADSGFRLRAPAGPGRLGGLTSLTPAERLKLYSQPAFA